MAAGDLDAARRATRREQVLAALAAGCPGDVAELPDKLEALRAATAAFAAAGTDNALIGGLAVGIRSGVPRATLDVDFALPSGTDRALLSSRLAAHGFRPKGAFAHGLKVVVRDDLLAMKRRAAADPGRRRSKALRDQADIALEGDVPDPDEGW